MLFGLVFYFSGYKSIKYYKKSEFFRFDFDFKLRINPNFTSKREAILEFKDETDVSINYK